MACETRLFDDGRGELFAGSGLRCDVPKLGSFDGVPGKGLSFPKCRAICTRSAFSRVKSVILGPAANRAASDKLTLCVCRPKGPGNSSVSYIEPFRVSVLTSVDLNRIDPSGLLLQCHPANFDESRDHRDRPRSTSGRAPQQPSRACSSGRWTGISGAAQRRVFPVSTPRAGQDLDVDSEPRFFRSGVPRREPRTMQAQTTNPKKRSNSAADFQAFWLLSQPEAAFRQNVWQSGAQNRMPKNG